MKCPHFVLLVALTLLIAGTLHFQTGLSISPDPTDPQNLRAADGTNQDIDERYARAYLQLAKLDLKQALTANKRLPGIYAVPLIDRLRNNAKIAEEQLRQILEGKKGKLHEVHLRSAESAVRIAELEWQQALVANKHQPGTFSDADLERFQVVTEVARLDLARAHDPANFGRPLPHLQWQVEQLRKEVLQLRFRVETLYARN